MSQNPWERPVESEQRSGDPQLHQPGTETSDQSDGQAQPDDQPQAVEIEPVEPGSPDWTQPSPAEHEVYDAVLVENADDTQPTRHADDAEVVSEVDAEGSADPAANEQPKEVDDHGAVADDQGEVHDEPVVVDDQGEVHDEPVAADDQGEVPDEPVVADDQGEVHDEPGVADDQQGEGDGEPPVEAVSDSGDDQAAAAVPAEHEQPGAAAWGLDLGQSDPTAPQGTDFEAATADRAAPHPSTAPLGSPLDLPASRRPQLLEHSTFP